MPQLLGYLERSHQRDRNAAKLQVLASACGFDDKLRVKMLRLLNGQAHGRSGS